MRATVVEHFLLKTRFIARTGLGPFPIVTLLCCGALLGPLLAQSPATSCPAVKHDTTGDDALIRHHFDAALSEYETALTKDPGSSALRIGKLRSQLGLGRDTDAFDQATLELAARPGASTGLTMRGLVEYWRGDILPASHDFTDAIKANPCDAAAHLGLSLTLSARGYAELGFTELRTARQEDPVDPAIRENWAKRFGSSTSDAAPTEADLKTRLKAYADAEPDRPILRQAYDGTLQTLHTDPPDAPCAGSAPAVSIALPLLPISTDSKAAARAGIEAHINGQSLRLLIDTTANGLLLNEEAALRLKLQPRFALDGTQIVIHGKVPSIVASVKSLSFGPAVFSDCSVRIIRNTRIKDYDGVIGTSVFADGLIQLTFQSAKFSVSAYPGSPADTPSLKRMYTLGLQGHWSSPRPAADLEFRRLAQSFYLIDGLLAVPGKTDVWKEGLLILDTGIPASAIVSRKPPTHFPLGESDLLRIGYRNDFGLESIHDYLQRTHTDTERSDEQATTIASMGLSVNVLATRKADSTYLAAQTGVSFKGTLGASFILGYNLTLDYRDRLYRLTDDHGMGFVKLTRGASYFGDLVVDPTIYAHSPVGLEPKE